VKTLFAVFGVVVGSLAIVGVAVLGGYDRGLLVPTPEAVVESFTHQITTRRYGLALNMLAAQTEPGETATALETRFALLLTATGVVYRVDAEPLWIDRDRSAARAVVRGDKGNVTLEFALVREYGLWKIESLPVPE